jgi:hypothetical protein
MWFKNHNRPSTQMQNGRREIFKFKQDSKKLSDLQYFSKLFYADYKGTMTSKWCDTYIAYYHRMKEDPSLTVADAKEMVKQVNDSIRKDLQARRLDITAAAASGVEGDDGEEVGDEDIEGDDEGQAQEEDDEGQDRGAEDDEGQD